MIASDHCSSPCEAVSLVRSGVRGSTGVDGSSITCHLGVSWSSSSSTLEALTVNSEISRLCWRVRGIARSRSISEHGAEEAESGYGGDDGRGVVGL